MSWIYDDMSLQEQAKELLRQVALRELDDAVAFEPTGGFCCG